MKKDIEIANDALNALNANYSIPQSKITVKVEKGWITLEGELPWNYEIEAAINAVSYLTGVKGVTSHMTIKLETGNPIEKKEIEDALAGNLSINEANIDVSVSETTITLSGTVSSLYQKEEASRIAWKSIGVSNVKNELVINNESIFN